MVILSRRLVSMIIATLALVAMFIASAPAHAATTTVDKLPFVNNFATARFKMLSTVAIEDMKIVSYGAGETVMPERVSLWAGTDTSDELMHMVQIGRTIYQRSGNGEWTRSEAGLSDMQFEPLSAQFNRLQEFADVIYDMGPANVGNTPTEHYQVWLSGTQALAMSGAVADELPQETRDIFDGVHYKYDFWVGTQDSFLYQQNVEILFAEGTILADAPAMQMDVLMTFYDINDPNISVNAPI